MLDELYLRLESGSKAAGNCIPILLARFAPISRHTQGNWGGGGGRAKPEEAVPLLIQLVLRTVRRAHERIVTLCATSPPCQRGRNGGLPPTAAERILAETMPALSSTRMDAA